MFNRDVRKNYSKLFSLNPTLIEIVTVVIRKYQHSGSNIENTRILWLIIILLILGTTFRRYMNDSGKGSEIMKLQSQNKQLEGHLSAYRQRLKDLTELIPKSELDRVLSRYGLKDILEVQQENGIEAHFASINGSNTPDLGMFNF